MLYLLNFPCKVEKHPRLWGENVKNRNLKDPILFGNTLVGKNVKVWEMNISSYNMKITEKNHSFFHSINVWTKCNFVYICVSFRARGWIYPNRCKFQLFHLFADVFSFFLKTH